MIRIKTLLCLSFLCLLFLQAHYSNPELVVIREQRELFSIRENAVVTAIITADNRAGFGLTLKNINF